MSHELQFKGRYVGMKNINRLNDVLWRTVSFAGLWKHTNTAVCRDLDVTAASVAQRDAWRRNSAVWQEIIPELSHRFRISKGLSDCLHPFSSFVEWNKDCLHAPHMCMCICGCVFMCVIQRRPSVTRVSITGRMSAARCLQWNLSVSCKRWRERRRRKS